MEPFGPLRCAACDYDLRGLPVPHRCPECGVEYELRLSGVFANESAAEQFVRTINRSS